MTAIPTQIPKAQKAAVHYMVDDPTNGFIPFSRPNTLTKQIETGKMRPACGMKKPPKHQTQEPEAATCTACKASAEWKAHMVALCDERETEPDPSWLPPVPAASAASTISPTQPASTAQPAAAEVPPANSGGTTTPAK